MKASELVDVLQAEIKHFGDQEVAICCDHTDGEALSLAPSLGLYSGLKPDEKYVTISCYECHDDAIREKHLFDGEPVESGYPDDDEDDS